MPRIENIPQPMILEHIDWHEHVHHRAARPGEEFLVWHQGYLERFHDWVNSLSAEDQPDSESIKPWEAIPGELKVSDLGWHSFHKAAEKRIEAMSDFSSLEELGDYIDARVHDWLHGASAIAWSEPVLGTYESPRSTYFWQLHGLIDYWREKWVDPHRASSPS